MAFSARLTCPGVPWNPCPSFKVCPYLRSLANLIRSRHIFSTAEHEAGLGTPVGRGVVDLAPKGDEIIHCRNDRYQHHEVDSGDCNPLDGQNKPAKMPRVPAVSQDDCHHRDDLDHRLELSQIARLNSEAFRTGNRTQATDQKLTAYHQYCHPG